MGSWNGIIDLPAGHVPSGAELLAWSSLLKVTPELYRVVKPADESVTSNITLQDDDDLQLPVVANGEYELFAFIIYDGATTGELKFGWAAPTGATLDWTSGGLLNTADATFGSAAMGHLTISGSATVTGAGANVNVTATPTGRLLVSSTAGVFKLQWAQGGSNATATRVRAGSYLRLTRVG